VRISSAAQGDDAAVAVGRDVNAAVVANRQSSEGRSGPGRSPGMPASNFGTTPGCGADRQIRRDRLALAGS